MPVYTYSAMSKGECILRSDGAIIPPDPNNLDWQDYQQWLAQGNTLGPAQP